MSDEACFNKFGFRNYTVADGPVPKPTPQVYYIKTDSVGDVTQEWCDDMAKSVNWLAGQREAIKRVLDMKRPEGELQEITVTSLIRE